jgi:hypothetical protein
MMSIQLFSTTDKRSSKVSEIEANPNVSLLFYSKEEKIQIRLEGKAELHFEGEFFNKQWQNSRPLSRRCYLTEPAPGTNVAEPTGGIPEKYRDSIPDEEETFPGRGNFCVVIVRISYIEWLYLHSRGHRRAKFEI